MGHIWSYVIFNNIPIPGTTIQSVDSRLHLEEIAGMA